MSRKTKPNDPITASFEPGNDQQMWAYEGLTKREYFAALALQGLLSKERNLGHSEAQAREAVTMADELIHELNKI